MQRTYKADGIYTASGDKGYRDVVTVSVTITNDRIASVTIDSYQDDEAYVSQVKKYVLQRFVNQQSANVTGVSGATYSSNAVKSAVANALAKAKA
ncbi:FMN-binding protein [Ethanoligenens sp.]|uniref:FMN-binding protein n=1 Tax=Ethanoligenens sp. TaxID=2099655 RepID=UPI0039EC7710